MIKRLTQSRFVRDVAPLQVAAGFTSLGNLVSTVALAFLMGPHWQGTFYAAMALYSLFYLLGNVGLSTAAASHVARAMGAKDRAAVAGWLAFLVKAGASLGALMLLLAWFVLGPLSTHFNVEPLVVEWAVWLCLLPLLELPRVVCTTAFQGARCMVELGQLESAIELARVFLVVAGLVITGSPVGAIWGTLVAGALGSVLALFSYHRVRLSLLAEPKPTAFLPSFRELVGGLPVVSLRRGLPLGIQIGLLRNIDALVVDVVPMLLVAAIGGPAQAAYFRIAQRFLRMPLTFLQGISRTAVPALVQLAQLADPARFKSAFYRATLGGGLLVGSGVLAALLLTPWVVRLLLPSEYWTAVPHAALILGFGYVVTSFSGALESFFIATGRFKVALRMGVAMGLPLLGLTALLGQRYGVDGVFVGCSLILSTGLVSHIYIWRCFASGTPVLPGQSHAGERL